MVRHPGNGPKQSADTARPAAPAASGPAPSANPAAPPPRAVLAAALGLLAAMIATGGTGPLNHPLRHVLTWLLLGGAVVFGPGLPWRRWRLVWPLAAAIIVALLITPLGLQAANVLTCAMVLAALALAYEGDAGGTSGGTSGGGGGGAMAVAAAAVAALGVWRVAVTSIGTLWFWADAAGGALGRAAGWLAGQPLWVGATYAGLDFLVLMAGLYAAWLMRTARPRIRRALIAAGAIVVAHLLYLVALAHAPRLMEVLPQATPAGPAPWWADTLRLAVPWNLPLLAALLHTLIAAAMLRWSPWPRVAGADPRKPSKPQMRGLAPRADPRTLAASLAIAVLAAALAVLTTLTPANLDLSGKKIVLFEEGYLNWLKPRHGEYGHLRSIGMYGLAPAYLESLGARVVISPDLSDADLAGADALVMFFPSKPWQPGQLDRVLNYVRHGGTLLVAGEHSTLEPGGGNRFNDVLAPTSMQVAFDSAMFTIGGWLHSYHPMAHPTTTGLTDERNIFGVVTGASVLARPPAAPLLVGRWGWADPGDPGAGESMMGNHRYDPGEKLGDLVLAAEQRLGQGRIIAFGDTSSFGNGITIADHPFTSRLYGYLASRSADPQAIWRQLAAGLAAVALLALLFTAPAGRNVAIAGCVAALALVACTRITYRATEVFPDGSRISLVTLSRSTATSPAELDPEEAAASQPATAGNRLAYIDVTHLERVSEESTRPEGLAGLQQTLMRSGYLVLNLHEFREERLRHAGMLVSVAPSRPFSSAERRIVRRFVEAGGIFICTVGYPEAGPSRALLADLGFTIGGEPGPDGRPKEEPVPMGHFKWAYVSSQDRKRFAYVRFHAGWEVFCGGDPAKLAVARGVVRDREVPIIVMRRVGLGLVVVVGDSGFAMCKNLENEHGEPFDGMYENADFWRWFIDVLHEKDPPWTPPAALSPAATSPATQEAAP